MSTLSVSSLQNTASPVSNIVLNSDGSSTVALYNAGIAPSPIQTGTLWYDISGAGLVIWDGASWVGVGGGGSGTVTSVTGTAPIVVATGSTTPAISINAATAAAPGSIQLATAAENAAGTDATKAVTPAFSVPKDASGMTGAAILPSGTDLQRAAIATPVVGMQRYNTDSQSEEIYTGATLGWRKLAYEAVPATLPADLTLTSTSYSGVYVCNNLTVPSGVTATVSSYDVTFICYGNVVIDGTINANGKGGWGSPGAEVSAPSAAGAAPPFGPGSRPGYRAPGVVPQGTYSPVVAVYGTGGWGGAAQTTTSPGGTAGGNGGNGGGGILIRAYGTITMGATGVLSANGTNAFGGAVFSGVGNFSGGGGGTGGCIILHADGNMTLSGTFSVTGGNGSGGADNLGGALGGQGGCGAGGGYIILQTPATLTDTSTKNLNGGSPGATFGSSGSQLGSISGSSFGGVGGSNASYAAPTGGSPGVVAYSGSPL